jgi:prephenate dehydrogenase
MWRDVCMANRTALLAEIDAYSAVLARFRAAIDASDGAALEAAFTRSRTARSVWKQGGGANVKPSDDPAIG